MSNGTTGAIKGGMAYVQAYLDDNPLTQGLAKLQSKLKSWQAGLSRLGAASYGGELPEPFAAIARFAASPAGAFSALLGAAQHTAAAREEMLKMSESTGVAVDKLSAMAYAARRAGISNEALASGLKRMEGKEFLSAMQGMGGKGGGGLKGMTSAAFAQMGAGDATDKLRQFIKLTENMPTAEKIGLARRLGLSELLPLINQGVESLDAFTQRAKDLGLVLSEQDAKAGKKFELALGDLHDVLMSSVSAIGGALVPMITGLSNMIVRVSVVVRDWLKDHKALTIAIFAGTAAIVAGGIALKGLAIVTSLASKAFALLQYAVKGVQVAFSLLSTAISWLPMLANPWVLAGLAIAGVVIWIAKLAGSFDGLANLWNGLASDFTDSMGAISNALSKGDIEAAWNVLTAFIKVEWIRVTEYLAQAWANFSDYFMGLLDKYAPWVSTVLRAVGKSWDWLWDKAGEGAKWFTGVWSSLCEFLEKTFGSTAKFIVGLWDKILDKQAEAAYNAGNKGSHTAYMPTEEVIKRKLKEEGGLTDAEADKRIAEMKANGVKFDHHEDVMPFDARKERDKDAQNLAAKEKAEFEARKKQRELEASARLDAAHLELKKAIDAANVPGADLPGGKRGGEAAAAMAASEHRTTFSGAVAAMLGGGGVNLQQQQLDAEKEQSEILRNSLALEEGIQNGIQALTAWMKQMGVVG